MKKCPFCKADIEDNARFCVFCMSSLQQKEKVENQVENNKRWPYILATILFLVLFFAVSIIILSKNDANNNSSLPYVCGEIDLSSQNYIIGDFMESTDNGNTNSYNTINGNIENTKDTTTQISTNNQENNQGNNNSVNSPTSSSFEGNSSNSQENSSSTGVSFSGSNVNSSDPQTNLSSSQGDSSSPQISSSGSQVTPSSSQVSSSSSQVSSSSSQVSPPSSQMSPSSSQVTPSTSQVTPPSSQDNSLNSEDDNVSTSQIETPSSPAQTKATYIYRDAVAADCYTPANIPAQPISDVIVITGVSTPASDGIYTIPETIDGKRVGAVMPYAFCDSAISSTVKKVVVPTSVKTIWQNAFSSCYNLTDIYISGKTIDIFENSFASVSNRTGSLKIHCSHDCKTFGLYYYRNISGNYDATYQEWNGGDIE